MSEQPPPRPPGATDGAARSTAAAAAAPADRTISFWERSDLSALSGEDFSPGGGGGRRGGGGGGGGYGGSANGGGTAEAEEAAAAAPSKRHGQGVSWDFRDALRANGVPSASVIPREDEDPAAVAGGPAAAPAAAASIFQPDLSVPSAPSSSRTAQSPVAQSPVGCRAERSFRGRPKGDGVGHTRKPTNITLATLASTPFEDEAETAIIRALEERDRERESGGRGGGGVDDNARFQEAMAHRRKATAAADHGIFSKVSNEAADMLEREAANGVGGTAEIEQMPSSDTVDTVRSLGRVELSPSPPSAADDGAAAGAERRPTLRTMAVHLQRMQKTSGALAEGGNYLKKARAAEAAASTRKFGRSGSDADNVPSRAAASAAERGFLPKVVGVPGAPPVSSADALVNNAAILLGDEGRDDDGGFDVEAQEEVIPTAPRAGSQQRTAAENWAKLRGGVRASAAFGAIKEEAEREKGGGDGGNEEEEEETEERAGSIGGSRRDRGRRAVLRLRARRRVRRGKGILQEVLIPKLHLMKLYAKTAVFVVILPMLFVASILYYVVGNPIAGCNDRKVTEEEKMKCASYSWWLIFLGIRQVITFSMAKATEVIFVEVLALRTKLFLRILGPYVTLLVVQARGWPFVAIFWATWDFALLHDPRPFSRHWLYYQNAIGMFNAENQAGVITNSDIYERVLIAVVVFGACVALKRGWLAFYLGKNSCRHYGPNLEMLMRKMLLISEVAHLSEEIKWEHYDDFGASGSPVDLKALRRCRSDGGDDDGYEDDDEESQSGRNSTPPASPKEGTHPNNNILMRLRKNTASARTEMSAVTAGDNSTMFTGSPTPRPSLDRQPRAFHNLGNTAKIKVIELVGEWEEPEIMAGSSAKDISIRDVLQFRQAVMCLDGRYPFSTAFGSARTREACIESAQAVFEDLLLRTPESDHALPFETISLVALKATGELDEDKARRLIRMFRPDRHGYLTALDFVRSCDKVYKNLRTLRAAIANSSQIDHAFEQIVDVFFYFVLWMIVLTIVKLNPWTLFLSLSGFIVSFAFMFGAAASKYFEGILLILIRRPYDIGDRVAISDPKNDTSANGSSTWFVEGVTLYTTTVRFATTNEVATYSNGSLSSLRIINGMRSPKATVYVYLKFASDVPYEKVMIFKSVIETFVKDRPRQWLSMCGFRATRVEADLGFIEYVVVLQHVELWQNIAPILTSKAELSSYCLEVQKKLDMKYSAPPLPVNLAMIRNNLQETSPFESDEIGEDVVEKESVPDLGLLGSLFAVPEPKKTK